MAGLIETLELKVNIQPKSSFPYAHNRNTAIWLGKNFPYEKAQQIIKWSIPYYKELHYIALSSKITPNVGIYDNNMYIGGSTKKALELGLQAWNLQELKKLLNVKSQEVFHEKINAKQSSEADQEISTSVKTQKKPQSKKSKKIKKLKEKKSPSKKPKKLKSPKSKKLKTKKQ